MRRPARRVIYPVKPVEPLKTLPTGYVLVKTEYDVNYNTIDIPEGATSLGIEASGYDGECTVSFYKKSPEMPNPNYSIEYGRYLAQMDKYNKDLKKYNDYKAKKEEEKKAKAKEKDMKLYERIKKKYCL